MTRYDSSPAPESAHEAQPGAVYVAAVAPGRWSLAHAWRPAADAVSGVPVPSGAAGLAKDALRATAARAPFGSVRLLPDLELSDRRPSGHAPVSPSGLRAGLLYTLTVPWKCGIEVGHCVCYGEAVGYD